MELLLGGGRVLAQLEQRQGQAVGPLAHAGHVVVAEGVVVEPDPRLVLLLQAGREAYELAVGERWSLRRTPS